MSETHSLSSHLMTTLRPLSVESILEAARELRKKYPPPIVASLECNSHTLETIKAHFPPIGQGLDGLMHSLPVYLNESLSAGIIACRDRNGVVVRLIYIIDRGEAKPMNEIQNVSSESAPTGGTFSIAGSDRQLPWNATKEQIQEEIDRVFGENAAVAAMENNPLSQVEATEVLQTVGLLRKGDWKPFGNLLPANRLSREQVVAVLETMAAEGVTLEYSQSQGFRPRTGEVPE